MTTYKHITAITNANGELEFHARTEEKPIREQFESGEDYHWVLSAWEESTKVFTAFDKEQKDLIMGAILGEAILDSPFQDISILYKKGVDVTDFVVIEEYVGLALEGWYAFYKSPSKEEPVRFHPDGSLSEHEVSRIKDPVAETEESFLLKFKFTPPPPDPIVNEDQRDILIDLIDAIDIDSAYIGRYDILINKVRKHFKITRLPKV